MDLTDLENWYDEKKQELLDKYLEKFRKSKQREIETERYKRQCENLRKEYEAKSKAIIKENLKKHNNDFFWKRKLMGIKLKIQMAKEWYNVKFPKNKE
ncbi:MAG: hypothetical protein V1859_02045 [archaeon]